MAITLRQDKGSPLTHAELDDNFVTLEDEVDSKLDIGAITNKPLVSPTITPAWTLYKADGTTPYTPPTSTDKNILVDNGVKANLSATYKYPVPTADQSAPTSVSGSFGTTLPAADVNSPTLVIQTITSPTTVSTTLAKPKTGLPVVDGFVTLPTGSETKSDSVSISFASRMYLINSTNGNLSGTDISNIIGGLASEYSKLQNGVNATFNNVTSGGSGYTYLISEGTITQVFQNDVLPVIGAFTYLGNVDITNPAGATVTVRRIRTNDTGSFNSVKLTTQ